MAVPRAVAHLCVCAQNSLSVVTHTLLARRCKKKDDQFTDAVMTEEYNPTQSSGLLASGEKSHVCCVAGDDVICAAEQCSYCDAACAAASETTTLGGFATDSGGSTAERGAFIAGESGYRDGVLRALPATKRSWTATLLEGEASEAKLGDTVDVTLANKRSGHFVVTAKGAYRTATSYVTVFSETDESAQAPLRALRVNVSNVGVGAVTCGCPSRFVIDADGTCCLDADGDDSCDEEVCAPAEAGDPIVYLPELNIVATKVCDTTKYPDMDCQKPEFMMADSDGNIVNYWSIGDLRDAGGLARRCPSSSGDTEPPF